MTQDRVVEWVFYPLSNGRLVRYIEDMQEINVATVEIIPMGSSAGQIVLCGYRRWTGMFSCLTYSDQILPSLDLFMRELSGIRGALKQEIPHMLPEFDNKFDMLETAYQMGLL